MIAPADAINAFGFELLARLRREQGGGNACFSAAGIHAAMLIAYAGARRKTERKLAKRLHLPPQEDAARAYGDFFRALDRVEDRDTRLTLALGAWLQSGYPVHAPIRHVVRGAYGATLAEADFADPVATAAAINAWVSRHTRGRIPEIASPGQFAPDARFALASAVYLKAAWAVPFEKEETEDAPFRTGRGRTVTARMMRKLEYRSYAEDQHVQVVDLDYLSDDLAMTILLPRRDDGLAELEHALMPEYLASAIGAFRRQRLDLFLPRFRFASRMGLRDLLSGLGMRVAFDPAEADFSGIADERPLFLQDALHEAWIDVNEEGTEAAAATMLGGRGGYDPDAIVTFRADHPFLFALRHVPSGALLFLGRVDDPTAGA